MCFLVSSRLDKFLPKLDKRYQKSRGGPATTKQRTFQPELHTSLNFLISNPIARRVREAENHQTFNPWLQNRPPEKIEVNLQLNRMYIQDVVNGGKLVHRDADFQEAPSAEHH